MNKKSLSCSGDLAGFSWELVRCTLHHHRSINIIIIIAIATKSSTFIRSLPPRSARVNDSTFARLPPADRVEKGKKKPGLEFVAILDLE